MSFKKLSIEEKHEVETRKQVFVNMIELSRQLGLRGKNGKRKYSELPIEKIKFLIDNKDKYTKKELLKKCRISSSKYQHISQKLGLANVYLEDDEITYCELARVIENSKHISGSYSYRTWVKYGLPVYIKEEVKKIKYIRLSEFYSWYKENLKVITLYKYKIGSLPNEPDWFIEKAKADKRAFEYMYKRPYTEEDKKLIKKLVSEGKTYMECSKVLKRTGSAIKRLCYDLGINKPRRTKPKLWTEKQINKMKDLWLKGYEPCIISEEIGRSDREIQSYLERKDIRYFGKPPVKFSKSEADNYKIKVEVR